MKLIFSPELDIHIRDKTKVDLDLFNYATKVDLMKATGVNTSKFARKVGSTIFKINIKIAIKR